MQTTRFRVWLRSKVPPDWTGVKLVRPPEYITDDTVDVMVEGDGSDFRRLIYDHWNIFAAYVQLKPQNGGEP